MTSFAHVTKKRTRKVAIKQNKNKKKKGRGLNLYILAFQNVIFSIRIWILVSQLVSLGIGILARNYFPHVSSEVLNNLLPSIRLLLSTCHKTLTVYVAYTM